MLSVKLDVMSVFLSPTIHSVCRERMASQGPKGRWEQRGTLATTELQVVEEKMGLRGPKARWVLKEKLALLVLLGRRYRAKLACRMLINIH